MRGRLPKGVKKIGESTYKINLQVKPGPDGRIRSQFTGSRDDLEEHLRRLQEGKPTGSEISLRDFGAQWRTERIKPSRNAKGFRDVTRRFKIIAEQLGHIAVNKITKRDLHRFRAYLAETGLSPQTQVHVLADLRNCLNYAEDVLDEVEAVPSFRRVMPRVPKQDPKFLTEEQLPKLFEALRDDPLRLNLVILDLSTGLRRQELADLKREHVVLGTNPHLRVVQGKGSKDRSVYLYPQAIAALERLAELPKQRRDPEDGGLYVSPLGAAGIYSIARRTREACGFKWTPHQLRHTYATLYSERGGKDFAIQQLLGHADIQTTQRYSRPRERAMFEDAKRVNLEVIPATPDKGRGNPMNGLIAKMISLAGEWRWFGERQWLGESGPVLPTLKPTPPRPSAPTSSSTTATWIVRVR